MNTVLWIVGVAVVIALIGGLVVWFVRRSNSKYAELWGRLREIVDGAPKGSKMTGRYAGMPLQARIDSQSSGDSSTTNYWEIVLTPGAQGKDWSLDYTGDGLLGTGEKQWRVKTKDDGLKGRLLAAGAIGALEGVDHNTDIAYKAKQGTLTYRTRVNSAFAIPGPDEFKQQLALLQRLVDINRQANVLA